MFDTLLYGVTIGAILYFFSIGLSITFGTMHIVNFAHGMVYSLGVYLFITFLPVAGRHIPPGPGPGRGGHAAGGLYRGTLYHQAVCTARAWTTPSSPPTRCC
jgi:ABC-type branched-subunit amino acid transport system permease subunit